MFICDTFPIQSSGQVSQYMEEVLVCYDVEKALQWKEELEYQQLSTGITISQKVS